jgi:ABC-type polysaccharide/polyol phosphate transport system ATPase subunit
MTNDIAIQVKNISKKFRVPHRKRDSVKNFFVSIFAPNKYEEFHALKDISFDVKKGEFLGIIGHNGAGKSTILKTLAGVYQADSGQITINGRISPFLELGIGFNPELSGRDNIYLNATVLGLSRREIDKRFDEIVQFAELEEFIDQQIKNYSSGMKSRLAFSVSIHANREILLMDEVLAVGDANFKKKCLDIFRGYKKQNKTVILVTHSMDTVREYCDRALLFHKGRLIEAGRVDEVCDEYKSRNAELERKNDVGVIKQNRETERDRHGLLSDEKKEQFIKSIIPYDNQGKVLKNLGYGESFYVDVKIEMKEVLENALVAIQIFEGNKNFLISGNNMLIDEYNVKWKKGKNIVRIIFYENHLSMGCIYFRASLFIEKGEQQILVDEYTTRIEDMIVNVNNEKRSGSGIVHMNHKWEMVQEY